MEKESSKHLFLQCSAIKIPLFPHLIEPKTQKPKGSLPYHFFWGSWGLCFSPKVGTFQSQGGNVSVPRWERLIPLRGKDYSPTWESSFPPRGNNCSP